MPDGKQHLGVQKRNGRSGKEICRCYLPHITVGQCGDILADALFRHTFGILAQNHAIQTKSAVRRLDNDMGRLAGLLNGTGKGKGDDVGAMRIANIVLETTPGRQPFCSLPLPPKFIRYTSPI